MALYEYECDCGNKREVRQSINDGRTIPVCACGRQMKPKISLTAGFIIKPTGREMALESLNSPNNGLPDSPYKRKAMEAAVAGLKEPPRRIW